MTEQNTDQPKTERVAWTSQDVARALKVSNKTVARWAKERKIPVAAVTIGGHRRFDPEEIRTVAARLREEAGQ